MQNWQTKCPIKSSTEVRRIMRWADHLKWQVLGKAKHTRPSSAVSRKNKKIWYNIEHIWKWQLAVWVDLPQTYPFYKAPNIIVCSVQHCSDWLYSSQWTSVKCQQNMHVMQTWFLRRTGLRCSFKVQTHKYMSDSVKKIMTTNKRSLQALLTVRRREHSWWP